MYPALFNVLERNDISYEIKSTYCVKCHISVHDEDVSIMIKTDTDKMLVTLYSPLNVFVPAYMATDTSLAVCMLNHSLADGCFCYDIGDGLVYFKMTSSFYNSKLDDSNFEYMLSYTADIIEEYGAKLYRLVNFGRA